MPVNTFQMSPTSSHRFVGGTMVMFYPNTSAAYLLAATAASAMTVGTALTLLESGNTRGITSIAFTSGAAQTSAFTFTIVGENQFGEQVTESVTTTGVSAVDHTLYCYRKIISITPTAKSSGATDTVSIGWVLTVTSGTPRIALPCKPTTSSSIRSIAPLNSATSPTFTAELARYTVAVSAQPLSGNPFGAILVSVDTGDPAL